MANLTAQQEKQVQEYVKQGIDKETAIRVVTAKGRKPATLKGNLNGERAFSLLK